jgi:hypothetical protein
VIVEKLDLALDFRTGVVKVGILHVGCDLETRLKVFLVKLKPIENVCLGRNKILNFEVNTHIHAAPDRT